MYHLFDFIKLRNLNHFLNFSRQSLKFSQTPKNFLSLPQLRVEISDMKTIIIVYWSDLNGFMSLSCLHVRQALLTGRVRVVAILNRVHLLRRAMIMDCICVVSIRHKMGSFTPLYRIYPLILSLVCLFVHY